MKARGVAPRWARLVAVLLLAALAASLIPLFAVSADCFPGPDDYRYGLTTHRVWAKTRSLPAVLLEAARVAGETYTAWQGSYAAIFLMALQPGVFSESLYGIGPAVLVAVLALSILYFCYTAARLLLPTEGQETEETCCCGLILGALIAICCMQFLPSPIEGYFWYNGGVYYGFFFSLSLVAAALLIRRRVRRTVAQWICLPLLMALLAGGNLVTGFLSAGLLLLYGLYQLVRRERDPLIVLCIVLLLGLFLVNALAPGNGVRQTEHADEAKPALTAILDSLQDGAVYGGKWLVGPGGLLALAAGPLLWRMAGRSKWKFRLPGLVTGFSYLLLCAACTPSEYALGFAGSPRILNVLYYQFIILLLLNLFWWAGWLRLRCKPIGPTLAKRLALGITAAFLLLCGGSALLNRTGASVSAARILYNGSAAAYRAAWEQRLVPLRDPAQEQVMLPRLPGQPPLICQQDVTAATTDEYYWFNQQLEAYYGKARILRERDPEA